MLLKVFTHYDVVSSLGRGRLSVLGKPTNCLQLYLWKTSSSLKHQTAQPTTRVNPRLFSHVLWKTSPRTLNKILAKLNFIFVTLLGMKRQKLKPTNLHVLKGGQLWVWTNERLKHLAIQTDGLGGDCLHCSCLAHSPLSSPLWSPPPGWSEPGRNPLISRIRMKGAKPGNSHYMTFPSIPWDKIISCSKLFPYFFLHWSPWFVWQMGL